MKGHTEKEILKFLESKRVVTTSELANSLNVSWNTAEKSLLELALDGKIERLKKEGVNLWVLK
jgi:Mn-dependent DtxR family transcriptional regulator